MTRLGPSIGEYPIYTERSYRVLAEDEMRVTAFTAALETLAEGRVVLDVGTGGELLWARVAARRARQVVAVESQPESFRQAERLLAALRESEPDLAQRITLVQGDATTTDLPACDVVVAEIIGSFASAEGAAVVLASIRDRVLRLGGSVVPHRAWTRVAAANIEQLLGSTGADFGAAELDACRAIFGHYGHRFDVRLRVAGANPSGLRSSSYPIEELTFNGDLQPEQRTRVSLEVTAAGPVDALVCWLQLEVGEGTRVLDSMYDETSWGSILLPFPDTTLNVEAGDVLEVDFQSTLSDDGIHPDYDFSVSHLRGERMLNELSVSAAHHRGPNGSTRLHRRLMEAIDRET